MSDESFPHSSDTHLLAARAAYQEAQTKDFIPPAQLAMARAQYEATLAVVAELRALRESIESPAS